MDYKKEWQKPYIIDFQKIGDWSIGYISVGEIGKDLPFHPKRFFWTYYTPESIVRGRHAHYQTEQILIAAAGKIIVNIEHPIGTIEVYTLESAHQGLYIPPNVWHTMQYSHNAVQLVLASTLYNENDYIRNYDEFKKHYST